MLYRDLPTAFVDLETTGGSTTHHRITEIAIIEVTAGGETREWSTLVNPGRSVPPHIGALTGIDDAMLTDAPRFEDVRQDVAERLDGRLFVAHNVQFDYGFLRRAFDRLEQRFAPRKACSVALSRTLYPDEKGHSLSALIERYDLRCENRHRALDDARVLHQWAARTIDALGRDVVEQAVSAQLEAPRVPPGLDPASIERLPAGPGVYLFTGDDDQVLYVGKSVGVRGRVLSHFSAAARDERERRLFDQTRHVRGIATAGELGALLREAELVKSLAPTFNRRLRRHRDLYAVALTGEPHEYLRARIRRSADDDAGEGLYGVFRTRAAATGFLKDRARDFHLCRKMLGLESGAGSCFAWQLKRCKGACVGEQSAVAWNNQLLNALGPIRREAWPFDGPVAIRETGRGGRDLHVIDRWRYHGTARRRDELDELLGSDPPFDADIYKLLVRHLRRKARTLDIVRL